MSEFGGMVSFTLRGGEDAALKVAERTKCPPRFYDCPSASNQQTIDQGEALNTLL
jgi:hypothetical protein